MDIKLRRRANVNEQTKVAAVEQQIFGEDDPSDQICQVAAGMCGLRTEDGRTAGADTNWRQLVKSWQQVKSGGLVVKGSWKVGSAAET